jgi:octanoyl-[GcvH]:protein N-octanoyltransferase
VASGELPPTLRVGRPGRVVAFGKRDVVSPGFAEAARAARERGFEAVERLGGGRGAVFHEGTIVFGHAIPEPNPRAGIAARFDLAAEIMVAAFRGLGIDARVGEVPGEYCPGDRSVNAAGARKLAGAGQRLISGGAHVGAVVVASGASLVNEVLEPVYAALGLEFDPAATGAVADEVPGVSREDVIRSLVEEYGRRFELEEGSLDDGTLELARSLAPEHLAPAT